MKVQTVELVAKTHSLQEHKLKDLRESDPLELQQLSLPLCWYDMEVVSEVEAVHFKLKVMESQVK